MEVIAKLKQGYHLFWTTLYDGQRQTVTDMLLVVVVVVVGLVSDD